VTVTPYSVQWNGHTTPDFDAGQTLSAVVAFENTSDFTWSETGPNPVRISYHWHPGDCAENNPATIYGLRTPLGLDLTPGSYFTTFAVDVQAPPTPGTWCLQYDVVRELVTWFSWQGGAVMKTTVAVN
jgi:hypothetical protein